MDNKIHARAAGKYAAAIAAAAAMVCWAAGDSRAQKQSSGTANIPAIPDCYVVDTSTVPGQAMSKTVHAAGGDKVINSRASFPKSYMDQGKVQTIWIKPDMKCLDAKRQKKGSAAHGKAVASRPLQDGRMDVQFVTPAAGITTGFVLAYGHPVKPPYQLERSSDTNIILNGVQIYPSLVRQMRLKEIAKPPAGDKPHLAEPRVEILAWVWDHCNRNELTDAKRREVLEHVLKRSDVFSRAEWAGDQIHGTLTKGRDLKIWCGDGRAWAEVQKLGGAPHLAETRDAELARIAKELSAGQGVLIGGHDGHAQFPIKALPAIYSILQDATLTSKEKAAGISKVLNNHRFAADIMKNYVQAEWQSAVGVKN
jgi:hypothetical protein